MYPSVYTLFFHHTNSPVYMHFFLSFFSRKVSLSSLFTPSFHTILTLCATATCGGELFFRDVHSKDEKKSFSLTKKSERIFFCPAQVPSFGSLISFPTATQCNAEEFWGGSERSTRSLCCCTTSECFESSLCILAFFMY